MSNQHHRPQATSTTTAQKRGQSKHSLEMACPDFFSVEDGTQNSLDVCYQMVLEDTKKRFGNNITRDQKTMDLVRKKSELLRDIDLVQRHVAKRKEALEVFKILEQKRKYEELLETCHSQHELSKKRIKEYEEGYVKETDSIKDTLSEGFQAIQMSNLQAYASASLEAVTKSCLKVVWMAKRSSEDSLKKIQNGIDSITQQEKQLKQSFIDQKKSFQDKLKNVNTAKKKYEEAFTLYRNEFQRRINFAERIHPKIRQLDPTAISPVLRFMLDVVDKDRLRLETSFDHYFITHFAPELKESFMLSLRDEGKRKSIIDRASISCPPLPSRFEVEEEKKTIETIVSDNDELDMSDGDVCIYFSDFSA